jgi:hypothetical protein
MIIYINMKKFFANYFNIQQNPNMFFIFPALAFLGVGIYTKDSTYIALFAVFIALSASSYTKPKK